MGELEEKEERVPCGKCVYVRYHDTFEYMGICLIKGELVITTDPSCEEFVEKSLDEIRKIFEERGGVYCVTCKKYIYSFEEFQEYLKSILETDVFSDDVASEESPAGD